MSGLDSVSYVNQYQAYPGYQSVGALNDDFLAQGTQILSAQPPMVGDTVSFQSAYQQADQGKKSNGWKYLLGGAALLAGGIIAHKNWGKISKWAKNLFKSGKGNTENFAAKIDRSFGLDKSSQAKTKARISRKRKSSTETFLANKMNLTPGQEASNVTAYRSHYMHYCNPVKGEEVSKVYAKNKEVENARKAIHKKKGYNTRDKYALIREKFELGKAKGPSEVKFQSNSPDFEKFAAEQRAKLIKEGILPAPPKPAKASKATKA